VKQSLESLDKKQLEGLRALTRVDFNVPLADGAVADATRIRASLPTIRWLREAGCRVVLCSHLGRPKGKVLEEFSLRQLFPDLEDLLGVPVTFVPEPASEEAVRVTRTMKRGEVALLENTRFLDGEETDSADVAESLAALGDFFVNDAFGAAHRAHASTHGVAKLLSPAVSGFLLSSELKFLGDAVENPVRPFVTVLGGAKISGKIDVVEALLPKVDEILIGGAMACTFFAAMGYETGKSLVEPDRIKMAKDLMDRAGKKLVLPRGGVVASSLEGNVATSDVSADSIPVDQAVFDIDEASAQNFAKRIRAAKTVLWNGPMGVFETPPFDRGTASVARALVEATKRGATTIVGGGDSAAAIAQLGLAEKVSHVSTGGGASLEFLEGKVLPGVAALNDV
jgi:phosphoglycerate kinase